MAVLSVTNLNDGPVSAAGDLPGSLRQAIFDANASGSDDSIEFASGLSGTINLVSGQLEISDDLVINGPGIDDLTIDAGAASRIFLIQDGDNNNRIDVELNNLTLTDGSVSTEGGAIFSAEKLKVVDSKITGNTATGSGGGIYANEHAATEIVDTELTQNSAQDGGGAFLEDNSEATNSIVRATIANNTAVQRGGGLMLIQTGGLTKTTIRESTITGNDAVQGGGLYAINVGGGTTEISDSTVSGNDASEGGGIFAHNISDGRTEIHQSTISGNTASTHGGGLKLQNQRQGQYGGDSYGNMGYVAGFTGKTTIRSSTISGNSSQGDGGGIYSFSTSDATNPVYANGYSYSYDDATAELVNTTVSGNSADGFGGGISSETVDIHGIEMKLNNSTVTGNTAVGGGGGITSIYSYITSVQTTYLTNTIVAENVGPNPDVLGRAHVQYSLLGDDTGADLTGGGVNLIGDSTNPIDPVLGPLANNGGPTQTHLLLSGSPAINAGDPNTVAGQNGVPTLDQRGVDRVMEGQLDMGSVEIDLTSPTIAVDSPSNGTATLSPVTISGTAMDHASVSGVELVIYNDQQQTWDGTSFTSAYTRVNATLTNPGFTSTDWTYNFVAPGNGQYTLRAIAIDGSGNTANSPWSQFEVASDTISIDTPSANHVPVNGPISGTATDVSGVDWVQLVIYNDQLQMWNGTAFTNTYSVVNATLSDPGATSTSWSYDGNLPDGAYTMRAWALDALGNQTSTFWRAFHVGNDVEPPGVTITTPSSNGATSSGSILLEGEATDDIAVRQVELVIYNDLLQTWNGSAFTSSYTRVKTSLSNAGGTNTDWTYNFAPPAGTYTFRAIARDGANKSTDSSWRSFSIT